MSGSTKWLVGLGVAAALAIAAFVLIGRALERRWAGDVETIAAASVQGLREQNRLSAFTARFVAVVTSEQRRFGLSAAKTLIMPGLVRYEVDLAKLRQQDVRWNEATRTLTVTLPAVELAGPEVDMAGVREFQDGRVLLALTDAETQLDAANRERGRAELLQQARAPAIMKLAEDAHRRAIERSFALPLNAAGLDAKVAVRFAHEGARDPSQLDRSRPISEVVGEQETPGVPAR